MADGKIVDRVNAELREFRDDLTRGRENPHIIRLTDSLIRLTNTPDQNEKDDAAAEAAAPKCPHDVVNRKTGKCVACGQVPDEE